MTINEQILAVDRDEWKARYGKTIDLLDQLSVRLENMSADLITDAWLDEWRDRINFFLEAEASNV